MICPTLNELPPPPPGKTGWPWTDGTPSSSGANITGQLPRISIITPSLNQGQFLEETVRSILLQGYPDLEYMILDGGSTDASCEVIAKYQQWLAYSVSEPDKGQANAINKGISKITGSIFTWINSDDLLLPNALNQIGSAHAQHADCIVAGDVIIFQDDSGAEELCVQQGIALRNFLLPWGSELSWAQPGLFFPVKLLKRTGVLDEKLEYAFDYDLLCRALAIAGTCKVEKGVAKYRHHQKSKTVSQPELFNLEIADVMQRYWSAQPATDVALAKRQCANLLARTGLSRALRGQSSSRFLLGALRMHPLWASYSALRWAARQVVGPITNVDPM